MLLIELKNYNKQACKKGVGRNFYSNEEGNIVPFTFIGDNQGLKRQNYRKEKKTKKTIFSENNIRQLL